MHKPYQPNGSLRRTRSLSHGLGEAVRAGRGSDAFALDSDEREWVPQSPPVWFKPLLLNVSQGLLHQHPEMRASGVFSRHRYYGPVHAFILRGTCLCLAHDWVTSSGDYAFKPAGETHTLVVPDDVQERPRRNFVQRTGTTSFSIR
jgi:hypothetical protein